ncbi:MAG: hypothetical protein DMF83_13260 [Acidobacteria bacterium]|nr:MAG: hypothetical protein DMF83_13260 [Acidobacteriota bacterium]
MRTRNRSRRAGLLFLAFLVPASAMAEELSRTLPRETPTAETLAAWERAGGQAEDGEQVVVYALFVNPLRPGLYEVTRFRIDRIEGRPGGRERRVKDTEKLIWNARPGTREPLLCYERTARRGWRTLWLRRWEWRRLAPGSAEYRAAMFTALRVYGLHRARLGLPPLG